MIAAAVNTTERVISLRSVVSLKSANALRGIAGQERKQIGDRWINEDRKPGAAFAKAVEDILGWENFLSEKGLETDNPVALIDECALQLGISGDFKDQIVKEKLQVHQIPALMHTRQGETGVWKKLATSAQEYCQDAYERLCSSSTKVLVERSIEEDEAKAARPKQQKEGIVLPAMNAETKAIAEFRDSLTVLALKEWFAAVQTLQPFNVDLQSRIHDFMGKFTRSGYYILDARDTEGLTAEMVERLKRVKTQFDEDVQNYQVTLVSALCTLLPSEKQSIQFKGMELEGLPDSLSVTAKEGSVMIFHSEIGGTVTVNRIPIAVAAMAIALTEMPEPIR